MPARIFSISGGVAEAVEHDVRALRGVCTRDAQPDAAGRAGDEGRSCLQHEISRCELRTTAMSPSGKANPYV
jgi:hypothetical protein